jgi:hypothetical protein
VERDRQFIIDEIEKLHPKTAIIKTKLLYSFPAMKLLNPHIHIDNIPNYVVILTVQNTDNDNKPYMLAMYSERALKEKDTLNTGKGFVSSVSNRKTYSLLAKDKNARLTEYNQYYIVFGTD